MEKLSSRNLFKKPGGATTPRESKALLTIKTGEYLQSGISN